MSLPGLRDRASLRRGRLRGRARTGPRLPGLRDRASLRLVGGLQATLAVPVFPVFVTGHHCGSFIGSTVTVRVRGLPGLRDRASLRPGTEVGGHPRAEGRLPGLRDRASLRPGTEVGGHPRAEGVFPVFVTGHHCGPGQKWVATRERKAVFPVFVTGHHCGRLSRRHRVHWGSRSSRSS